MFSKLPRTGRKAGIDVCLLLENSTACQKSVPKYPVWVQLGGPSDRSI